MRLDTFKCIMSVLLAYSLIQYLDKTPLLLVKFGPYKDSKMTKTCFSLMWFCVICHFIYSTQMQVQDIVSFLCSTLVLITTLPWLVCVLWYIWFGNNKQDMTIQDLAVFDRLTLTISDGHLEPAVVLEVILIALLFVTTIFQSVYFNRKSLSKVILYLRQFVVYISVSQLIIYKYLILKRFKVIKQRLIEGNVLRNLSAVRLLIDINSRINELFSPVVTFALLLNTCNSLTILADLWRYFGLSAKPFCVEHVFSTLVLYLMWSKQLVWAISLCSEVSSQNIILVHELDRLLISKSVSRSVRTQVVVFMNELYHSPTEFVCMDFFTIDNAAVSAFFGLLVNMMMIYVQFMKH